MGLHEYTQQELLAIIAGKVGGIGIADGDTDRYIGTIHKVKALTDTVVGNSVGTPDISGVTIKAGVEVTGEWTQIVLNSGNAALYGSVENADDEDQLVEDTAEWVGDIRIIEGATDGVVADAVGTPTLEDQAVADGARLYGVWTSVTLTSGSVTLYGKDLEEVV